jgi:hypothetical protein
MEQQSACKTYKYKLMPTSEQEQALETAVWRCRDLYNAALEERKTAWERRQISVTYYQQKAELPDLKAEFPDYAEVNAQVLQDVILRVERTFQAFFRRVQVGEKPGYPRFRGWGRYNSFTYPQDGGGGAGRGRAQPLEDWAYSHSAASPHTGDSQDGHDLARGGWLVRLYLLCGGASGAVAAHWGGDRH